MRVELLPERVLQLTGSVLPSGISYVLLSTGMCRECSGVLPVRKTGFHIVNNGALRVTIIRCTELNPRFSLVNADVKRREALKIPIFLQSSVSMPQTDQAYFHYGFIY